MLPGAPKGTDFNGEATSYIDDFEGSQNAIDLKSPLSWFLSSTPADPTLGYISGSDPEDQLTYKMVIFRSKLNWYTIDPIFYSSQRPDGITDDDCHHLIHIDILLMICFPLIWFKGKMHY